VIRAHSVGSIIETTRRSIFAGHMTSPQTWRSSPFRRSTRRKRA
jgi:hypothetical protein